MDDIHLLKLNFNDQDYLHIQNIRKVVFNDELGISESKIFDEYDKTCDHFLIFYGINIIGSLRISVFGQKIKLERMAILKKYRVNHYGKKKLLLMSCTILLMLKDKMGKCPVLKVMLLP